MSVRRVDPESFESASSVLVDSDAPTNAEAVREIEAWATEHGFVRTREYWLRVIVAAGRRVFRGTCYRLTDEERGSAETRLREIEDRASRLAPPRSA